MTVVRTRKLPMLVGLFVLLLMGFAGASYGAVRFDAVRPSAEETANVGMNVAHLTDVTATTTFNTDIVAPD